jgi:GNAT superfamily N-acetyltransferase
MNALPTRSDWRPAEPGACDPVRLRRAIESDREPLLEMFARCSGETRYLRFHGHVNVFPQRYLSEAVSGSPAHYALVGRPDPHHVTPGADVIVALASCRTVAEGVAELGFLVEDAYQRQGIGGRLLRELVGYADGIGLRVLQAQVLAEQAWIAKVLRRYGHCHVAHRSYGTLEVTIRLDSGHAPVTSSRAD